MTGWRDEASCRGKDPERWHLPKWHAYAVSVCRRCPVRAQCLAQAVASGEEHGVWGGLTPEERTAGPSVAERERLVVLAVIGRGASTVGDVMARVGVDRRPAQRHVRRLERDGLVVVSRNAGTPLRIVPAPTERMEVQP